MNVSPNRTDVADPEIASRLSSEYYWRKGVGPGRWGHDMSRTDLGCLHCNER
jgi:hypothetical protein